jgi:hypothetical protein
MITFTVRTSHPVKEVHLKFFHGRLISVQHDGYAYGIECIHLSDFSELDTDYPLERTLQRAVSEGQVQDSSLDHIYMVMTIVFNEEMILNMSRKRTRLTREIRILYKPHERENHRG